MRNLEWRSVRFNFPHYTSTRTLQFWASFITHKPNNSTCQPEALPYHTHTGLIKTPTSAWRHTLTRISFLRRPRGSRLERRRLWMNIKTLVSDNHFFSSHLLLVWISVAQSGFLHVWFVHLLFQREHVFHMRRAGCHCYLGSVWKYVTIQP